MNEKREKIECELVNEREKPIAIHTERRNERMKEKERKKSGNKE